jgi:hypothetical protein
MGSLGVTGPDWSLEINKKLLTLTASFSAGRIFRKNHVGAKFSGFARDFINHNHHCKEFFVTVLQLWSFLPIGSQVCAESFA